MAFVTQLNKAMDVVAMRSADPLRQKVEDVMRGQSAMSTNALLDLLGLANTTANARLLARSCRSLGLIPMKSRRLLPGGFAGNTITRGWAKPVREMVS